MSGLDELTAAVTKVAETLETHGVSHFITGSFASSLHAEFRTTNDVDIVADFRCVDLSALMGAFETDFFADAEQAIGAVAQGHSFNIIHRIAYLKVDFFPALSAFNGEALTRADRVVLEPGRPALPVATREDIPLAKLWWYRLGDESSEQQHRGIIALNRDQFDRVASPAGPAPGGTDRLARPVAAGGCRPPADEPDRP